MNVPRETLCPRCGLDPNSLGGYVDYVHYKNNQRYACLPYLLSSSAARVVHELAYMLTKRLMQTIDEM